MASFKFYFLSALICGVLILGQAADVPPPPPTAIIDLKPKSTEPATLVPDTTTPATTESTTTTTTTTAPNTTTSTTEPPTTTTTTSTTTTTPPPTTPPTPPAPPKPIGPPDQGLWKYEEKNVTCVIVQFAGQLNVTYPKPNTSNHEFYHVLVNVPKNASAPYGNCEGAEQWLTISWPSPIDTSDRNNTMTIRFAKNETTKSYELTSLNVSLDAAMFPNFTNADTLELHHGAEWATPLAASYRCAAATELGMNEAGQTNVVAKLTLSQLQEEAFRTQSGTGFSAARDCAGGDIPDAVPIAVGCALGGMVVVVLIAYLVARRRSAARGYLSM